MLRSNTSTSAFCLAASVGLVASLTLTWLCVEEVPRGCPCSQEPFSAAFGFP